MANVTVERTAYSRHRQRVLATLCVLTSLLAPACRDSPATLTPWESVAGAFDLVAGLSRARTVLETGIIDLGNPSHRDALIWGWGSDERWGPERTFAWAVGPRSTIELYVAFPRTLTLELSCWSLAMPDPRVQTIEVRRGERTLGQVAITSSEPGQVARIPVPADALVRGANRFSLHYRYTARPADHGAGSQDHRELAVACDRIALSSPTGPPTAQPEHGLLELPFGSEVRYLLDLGEGALLEVADLRTYGTDSRGARLEIEVRSQDGPASSFELHPEGRAISQELGPGLSGLVELTLLARAANGAVAPGGIRLRSPRVRSGALAEGLQDGVLVGGALSGEDGARDSSSQASTGDGAQRWNVVVYVVDTLRADHLGCYGYQLATSPAIDRLAAESALFTRTMAQTSWTRPAVATILTGLAPDLHGVHTHQQGLPSEVDTLAEILRRHGYATAAFITNGNIEATFGFDQGFDLFHRAYEEAASFEFHKPASVIHRRALRWLDAQGEIREPFFLYLHATDPHAPYTPDEPYRARFAAGVDPQLGALSTVVAITDERRRLSAAERRDLVALYDAEIAQFDDSFGEFLVALQERGLWSETLFVFLSDHGEEFGEHGRWQHGLTLYPEQLRIPLIVRRPDRAGAGERLETLARQVDVVPTVLASIGLDIVAGEGRSLFDPSGAPSLPDPALLGTAVLRKDPARQLDALLSGERLLVYHHRYDQPRERRELFDYLRPPPGDRLAARDDVATALLEAQLLARRSVAGARTLTAPDVILASETEEQLRALGYIDPIDER